MMFATNILLQVSRLACPTIFGWSDTLNLLLIVASENWQNEPKLDLLKKAVA
jgi:hypothetical protein